MDYFIAIALISPSVALVLWLAFCLLVGRGRSSRDAARIIRAAGGPLRRPRKR